MADTSGPSDKLSRRFIPSPRPQDGSGPEKAKGRPHHGHRPEGGRPASDNSPRASSRVFSDRYNPKVLNQVLSKLRAFIARPDKGFELAAKQQMAQKGPGKEAAGVAVLKHVPEGAFVMKDGKMVSLGAPKSETPMVEEGPLSEAVAHVSQADQAPAPAPAAMPPPSGMQGHEDLTPFEQVFLARFEGGQTLETPHQPGEPQFLPKSEQVWAEFFQRFLPFTLDKKMPVAQLEALIYRGLLLKKGEQPSGEQGTLVSDLKFVDGTMDKFARLPIQQSKILEELSSKIPGDVLAQALVAEWIGGPELAYKALSHKIVNPELAKDGNAAVASYKTPQESKAEAMSQSGRQATQGIALSARTEQLMAQHLDIDMRPAKFEAPVPLPAMEQKRESASSSSWLGALFGRKKRYDEPDAGSVFVPWFQPFLGQRTKFPGKVRWWVLLLYFVAVSTAGLAAFVLIRFMIQR